MFDFLAERVRRSRRLGLIGLATTDRPEDDRLAEHAIRLGVAVFRGSSEDVLGRLAASARAFNADPVIELLGDSPLVDGELIDDVVDFFHSADYDYVATVTREYPFAPVELKRFPIGIRVQVMKAGALARCEKQAKEPRNREHSTTLMYENPGSFRIGYFEAKGRWADLNRPDGFLAVNYPEDLQNVSAQVEWTIAKDPSCALRSLVW